MLYVILLILTVFLPLYSSASPLNSSGTPETCTPIKLKTINRTFKIAEKDLLSVIQKQLRSVDWTAVDKRLREKVLEYKPRNSVTLAEAKKHKVRYYDPTFILPFDIRDADGNVLFERGTAVNPLDRVPEAVWKNRVYVFFNLKDKYQREFVKDYLKENETRKIITLIADGNSDLKDIHDFMKVNLFPVYALTNLIAGRFGVNKTLSVVTFKKVNGKGMVRIEEIPDSLIKGQFGGKEDEKLAKKASK